MLKYGILIKLLLLNWVLMCCVQCVWWQSAVVSAGLTVQPQQVTKTAVYAVHNTINIHICMCTGWLYFS